VLPYRGPTVAQHLDHCATLPRSPAMSGVIQICLSVWVDMLCAWFMVNLVWVCCVWLCGVLWVVVSLCVGRQLLKMGTWLPETCWATCKGEMKDKWRLVGFLSTLLYLIHWLGPTWYITALYEPVNLLCSFWPTNSVTYTTHGCPVTAERVSCCKKLTLDV